MIGYHQKLTEKDNKMIKKVTGAVERLLSEEPVLRDNDSKLVANVWYALIGDAKVKEMSAMDFLKAYSSNLITPADTITRARRKIQEDNPDFRGEKWADRHILANKVRREVHTWDTKRYNPNCS